MCSELYLNCCCASFVHPPCLIELQKSEVVANIFSCTIGRSLARLSDFCSHSNLVMAARQVMAAICSLPGVACGALND